MTNNRNKTENISLLLSNFSRSLQDINLKLEVFGNRNFEEEIFEDKFNNFKIEVGEKLEVKIEVMTSSHLFIIKYQTDDEDTD